MQNKDIPNIAPPKRVFNEEHIIEGHQKPRTFAVKRFAHEGARNNEFKTLSDISKELSHDCIVKVYCETPDRADHEKPYGIAFKLEGPSVEERMTAVGLVPRSGCIHILVHILRLIDAVSKLHRLGFHCDIKPANILLKGSGDGFVLIDFEHFIWIGEVADGQIRGCSNERDPPPSPNNKEDGKSDVWTLGCFITELLIWWRPGDAGGRPAVDTFRKELADQQSIFQREPPYDKTEYFYVWPKSGHPEVIKAVRERLEKLECCPVIGSLASILWEMFNVDPVLRPTAKEVYDKFKECIQAILGPINSSMPIC